MNGPEIECKIKMQQINGCKSHLEPIIRITSILSCRESSAEAKHAWPRREVSSQPAPAFLFAVLLHCLHGGMVSKDTQGTDRETKTWKESIRALESGRAGPG